MNACWTGEGTVPLEALDGRDLLVGRFLDRDLAAADGIAVEDNGAGAALAFAAAVLRTGEGDVFPKDPQESSVGIHADAMPLVVDT
jgi:hypothetical protein